MAESQHSQPNEELQRVFTMLDKGGTGEVGVAEIADVMRSLGHDPDENELQKMINEVDIKGTGSIQFEEFAQLVARQAKHHHGASEEEYLWEAFQVFDPEGEGFITAAKLKDVMEILGEKMTFKDADLLIEKVTKSTNGKVNFKAFCDALQSKPNEEGSLQ